MQTNFHLAITNEKIKPDLSDQNHNWINCEKNFNKLSTYIKYLYIESETWYGACHKFARANTRNQ